jgi:hypothetical protein
MFGHKSSDYTPPAQLPGRNDPCHCGSGKKYKKCCEDKDANAKHAVLEKQWSEAEKAAAKKAEDEKEKQKGKTGESQPAVQVKSSEPRVSEHHHKAPTIPKFNMPRRTGGG